MKLQDYENHWILYGGKVKGGRQIHRGLAFGVNVNQPSLSLGFFHFPLFFSA